MSKLKCIKDERGKLPLPLILIAVLLIGGAVFAFLAFSGVIVIPGITPEEEEAATQAKVETSPEKQFEDQLRQLINDRAVKDNKISELEERIELKVLRGGSLKAKFKITVEEIKDVS